MSLLGEYISGRGGEPSKKDLHRLLDRYEWFTSARRARALITGENDDPALALPLDFWPTVPPTFRPPVFSAPVRSVPEPPKSHPPRPIPGHENGLSHHPQPAEPPPLDDLIDRFIALGAKRIDPETEAREARVDIDIDPGMVTVELAEISRSQGLYDDAEKIYRILNLRD
jgi:hypothetical protein